MPAATVSTRMLGAASPTGTPTVLTAASVSLPLAPLPCWVPTTAAARTNALTLKVSDLTFVRAPDVPGYMQPAPDTVKLAAFGRLDLRACHAFTLTPLALGTVLKDVRGDYWVAELPSDIWPPPHSCVTLMRHLVAVPADIP